MREVGVKSQGGVASINLFPNANVASAWHLHFFLPYFFVVVPLSVVDVFPAF